MSDDPFLVEALAELNEIPDRHVRHLSARFDEDLLRLLDQAGFIEFHFWAWDDDDGLHSAVRRDRYSSWHSPHRAWGPDTFPGVLAQYGRAPDHSLEIRVTKEGAAALARGCVQAKKQDAGERRPTDGPSDGKREQDPADTAQSTPRAIRKSADGDRINVDEQYDGPLSIPMSRDEAARRLLRNKKARWRKAQILIPSSAIEVVGEREIRFRLDMLRDSDRQNLQAPLKD